MKVLFRDLDAFLDELRRDRALVHRSLVRLDRRCDEVGEGWCVSVTAAALVVPPGTGGPSLVVELRLLIGATPRAADAAGAVRVRAENALRVLGEQLRGLGLDVRRGSFEGCRP